MALETLKGVKHINGKQVIVMRVVKGEAMYKAVRCTK